MSTMNLGTLFVKLNGDSKDLLTSFSKASQVVEKFARETKKLANDVAQVSGAMLALGAGAMALAAQVDGRAAKSMDNLKKSTQLLAVQVADVLQPAVASLTDGFKRAADFVAGLDPKLKEQLGTWAKYAAIVAVAAKGLGVVAGLVNGVAGAVSAAAGALGAVGLGPLLAFVAALAAVAAGIAAVHYAFRTNLGGIADMWKKLTDWLSATGAAAFDGLIKFATTFADSFLAQLRDLADGAAKFFDLLGSGEMKKKALNIYQSLEGARQGLLQRGLKGVVTDALDLGKAAGTAFLDEWKRILKDMGLPDFGAMLNNGGHARQPVGAGGATRGSSDLSGMGFMADEAQRHRELMQASAARAKSERDFAAANYAAQNELARAVTANAEAQRDQARATAQALKRIKAEMSGSRAGLTLEESVQFGVSTRKQDEQYRRGNMSSKQLAEEDSAEAARKWAAVGAVALNGITQAMGEVGNIVQSAAQAGAQGGPWAAVIAVIMEFVKKTKAAAEFMGIAAEFVNRIAGMIQPLVKPIFDALTGVLGAVMQYIGPVFKALQPFAELVAQSLENLKGVFFAIGMLVEALMPIIQFVGELMKAMDTVMKPLLDLIGGVIKAIATVILGLVIMLNEIAAAFGDRKARKEADRLKKLVDDMWRPAAESRAAADQNAAAASLRNADAQNEAAAAAQKVAEAFTNVPSGYKLGLARLRSMQEGDSVYGAGAGFWADASSSGSSSEVTSAAASISEEVAARIAQEAETAAYNAYSDAIAAGLGYAAAVEAQDAARQAYLDSHGAGKGDGSSSKSTGPGFKTPGSTYSSAIPTADMASGEATIVIHGDLIIQSDAGSVADLLRDVQRLAQKQKGQTTGNPFRPE